MKDFYIKDVDETDSSYIKEILKLKPTILRVNNNGNIVRSILRKLNREDVKVIVNSREDYKWILFQMKDYY